MKTVIVEEQEKAICEYYSYPHSQNDTCSFFHISRQRLSKILKKHKIEPHSAECRKQLNVLNTQAGIQEKYGVKFASQMPDHAEKCAQTKLLKYGNSHFTNRDKAKQTWLKKYGVENPQQNSKIRKQTQDTMIAKYGFASNVESPAIRKKGIKNSRSEIAKRKRKQTCLTKFGAVNNLVTPEQLKRTKQLMLDKYGVESYTQTEEYRKKTKQTSLKKYGVDCYAKTGEFKIRIGSHLETILNKSKQACLEKYGVDYYMQSDEFKRYMQKYIANNRTDIQNKAKNTCLTKYGAEYYFNSTEYKAKLPAIKEMLAAKRNEIQQKGYETKRKNGTFNASRPEDDFYELLVERFGADDVARQHKDARYPFACDFYVKSKDLFIELNLSWTHGGHPFDANDASDAEKLRNWQIKAEKSKYYANAIKTWTARDANKLICAKSSSLNYEAFYSMANAVAWLATVK